LPIQQIHTFLVRPGKGGHERLDINGTDVPLNGRIFSLLGGIYDRAGEECKIHISFRRDADGNQQNECRSLLTAHLRNRTLDTARLLAERLRDTTDGRSGLGLLFLVAGTEGTHHKIVISRFPTDSAILVDENPAQFTVEFLERVFMKNKTSYKAALYQDVSLQGGFWTGRAIDKQINGRGDQLSDYWITDFLLSEFATTPAAGSRRLGKALREAVAKVPIEIKEELISAGRLASGLAGQPISINGFADRFGLSESAKEALVSGLKSPRTADEQFMLDVAEFRNHIAYQSVEMDNGALLTASFVDFEDVFEKRYLDETRGNVEFTTRGRIVNEKLKTQR
jgi:hypothetical protein